MFRFLAGCAVGALGGTYLLGLWLLGTREQPAPSTFPTRTLGSTVHRWGKDHDGLWTSGPAT
jgi:hypothetical protein